MGGGRPGRSVRTPAGPGSRRVGPRGRPGAASVTSTTRPRGARRRTGRARWLLEAGVRHPVLAGSGWAAAVPVAFASGRSAVAALLAATGALGAARTAVRWTPGRPGAVLLAAGITCGTVTAATPGAATLGVAVLIVVGTVLVWEIRAGLPPFAGAAAVLGAAAVPSAAGAGLMLVHGIEPAAALSLLGVAAMHDAARHLVGADADGPVEPVSAAALGMAAVVALTVALRLPPFEPAAAWFFGGFAAGAVVVARPVARLALGRPLPPQRLESLWLAAPLWAWLVGVHVAAG